MHLTQIRQRLQHQLKSLAGNRVFLFYVASYLLFAATAFRMVPDSYYSVDRWYVIELLLAYLILLSTERLLTVRIAWYQPVYFLMQTGIVLAMSRVEPFFDYYPILFMGLCIQAVWFAPQKAAVWWIILMLVGTTLAEISVYGFEKGMGYTVTYLAAGFFITVFGLATLRAERAKAESQELLVELQSANRRLKEYSEQVQELATVQERNRLARELHDSVTQTIFSITLTAQSALILIDRDPSRVKDQLKHLQSLSKSALGEMRALIQQLHLHTVAEEGLVTAVRGLAAERKENDGLAVEVKLLCADELPPRLPADVEECLFRVIQEALNNVVKHAKTSSAAITLDLRSNPVKIWIEDQGVGFDPIKMMGAPGHFGLSGMEERLRSIGGRSVIESQPGAGTCVRIEGLWIEELKHV